MKQKVRYIFTALAGSVITVSLFYVMQYLIANTGDRALKDDASRIIEFSRTIQDTETRAKERELPKKEQAEQPPPPPEIDLKNIPKPSKGNLDAMGVMIGNMNLMGVPSVGTPSDGEEVPLVRIEPRYPQRALSRGIEGWVQLEFTISETGAVVDPVVIDSEPSSIFNRAAVRAVQRWKYKPKVENGVPVKRSGVQVVLTFKIQDDGGRRRG